MKKLPFVASLYIAACSCLLLGGGDLYRKGQFWLDGQSGFMESSDPTISRAAKYGDPRGLTIASVTYVTESGTVSVSNKYLSYGEVKRLNAGGRIPLRFLKSNPHDALVDGEQTESPWGWLIAGVMLLAIAIYAHYLLRRENANVAAYSPEL